MLFAFGCASKTTTVKNDAVISFAETQHDFGTIVANKPVDYRFEFSNPGKTPLIINDVVTSCGCTAADWTKTVVMPGGKGFISVRFDAVAFGLFNKSITVNFNGIDSPAHLSIKGSVKSEDE